MVKFGVMIKAAPYEEMAERGILVERLGFDSLWVPDHMVLEDYRRFCPESAPNLGVSSQPWQPVPVELL